MKLFFWKDNPHIDTFAQTLADDLFSHVQPDAALAYFSADASTDARNAGKKALAQNREIDRRIKDLVKKVKQFRTQYALGIYGKARLNLKFMERLKDLGFAPEVAKKLNQIILLQA